jgi:hypothetical protein
MDLKLTEQALKNRPKMIQGWYLVGLIYIVYILCEGYN